MDNETKNTGSDWLDEILGTKNTPKELGPDEIAVAAAGLTHPDDAELEKIIQETMAENWGDEPAAQEAAPAPSKPETPAQPQKKAPQKARTTRRSTPTRRMPVHSDVMQVEETEDSSDSTPKKFFDRTRTPGSKPYGLWGIPHIVSSFIWLAVILAIGISVGRLGWLCATDLLALGKAPIEVTLTLEENEDIESVAQKLKDAGLIKYPKLFVLFTDMTGKCENMLAGTVQFNAPNSGDPESSKIVYDYNALANALTYKKTEKSTVEVLIPEGYSCAQIFALLEEKGVCTARELEVYAANGELDDYWFLDGVERGHKYSLEGFLFPDTYKFYVGDKPRRVLEKFLDAFDNRFSDRLKDKYAMLNANLGLNLSIREVVIMASIVEKEKANDEEGYSIASVFYNRLTHAASYPYLNSDATLLYDVEYYTGKGITNEQKAKSPYNTYTHRGLPAGPIANPGLASIEAALDPETTSYYYYVLDPENGVHQFSKTLAEHEKKIDKLYGD